MMDAQQTMNWKVYVIKRSWPNLKHCIGIYLEGLRKSMKILSQDNRSPALDLSQAPPDFGYISSVFSEMKHEVRRTVTYKNTNSG
jgi:hypothetical protein